MQLQEGSELAEQDKRNAVELATTKVASDLQKFLGAKDAEIQTLTAKDRRDFFIVRSS